MPTLTVRDLPDDIYEQLCECAAAHGRSLSGEIVALLGAVLLPQPIDAQAEAVAARFPVPLPGPHQEPAQRNPT